MRIHRNVFMYETFANISRYLSILIICEILTSDQKAKKHTFDFWRLNIQRYVPEKNFWPDFLVDNTLLLRKLWRNYKNVFEDIIFALTKYSVLTEGFHPQEVNQDFVFWRHFRSPWGWSSSVRNKRFVKSTVYENIF